MYVAMASCHLADNSTSKMKIPADHLPIEWHCCQDHGRMTTTDRGKVQNAKQMKVTIKHRMPRVKKFI